MKTRICYVGLFVLIILTTFQNCSQPNSGKYPSVVLNDGTTYGGMTTYLRSIPGFTCIENSVPKPAPFASIKIGNEILLTQNSPSQCGASQSILESSSLFRSVYQDSIIGYKEGIFILQALDNVGAPNTFVSVWCVDQPGQDGIETVITSTGASGSDKGRVYYAVKNPDGSYENKVIPDFVVFNVSFGVSTLTYTDNNGFKLDVYFSQNNQGILGGHLQAVIEGKQVSRSTYCRLGGYKDLVSGP